MATAVFDASVAVKWFVPDTLSDAADKARALFTPVAPWLLVAEAANAFWTYVRAERMAPEDAVRATRALPDIIEIDADLRHVAAATALAAPLEHSVYDMIYVALARDTGAPLVTADARLAAALARASIDLEVIELSSLRGA